MGKTAGDCSKQALNVYLGTCVLAPGVSIAHGVLMEFIITFLLIFTISRKRTPFYVLISCFLSLRTKDQTTSEASRRLFAVADNPEDMARIPAIKVPNSGDTILNY